MIPRNILRVIYIVHFNLLVLIKPFRINYVSINIYDRLIYIYVHVVCIHILFTTKENNNLLNVSLKN